MDSWGEKAEAGRVVSRLPKSSRQKNDNSQELDRWMKVERIGKCSETWYTNRLEVAERKIGFKNES